MSEGNATLRGVDRREKFCPKCGKSKPIGMFDWRDSARTRSQSYCRDCAKRAWRRWYSDERNRRRHLQQLARRRRRRIDRNRKIVADLKSKPCADCGLSFPPYVMDFDHIGPKTGEIPVLVRSSSTDRLLKETAKCEVVCSNCHRIRSFMRRQRDSAQRTPTLEG